MRHLLSAALALVLAPLIYVSAGFSAVKFGEANEVGRIEAAPAALGLLAALVAGGLYALLVMGRLSPVGPFLGGLLYLGVTLWRVFDYAGFARTFPDDLLGVESLMQVPAGFGTALLAVPLLFTIVSAGRWRGADATSGPASFSGPASRSGPAVPSPYDAAPTSPSTGGGTSYPSSG
jgi:hypothetical protein